MKGKIIEINANNALVTFENGFHSEFPLSQFHNKCKSGDSVNMHKLNCEKHINEKHINNIF